MVYYKHKIKKKKINFRRYEMTPEAKRAAAKYAAEWRRMNPEKVKAIREKYWQKKAAQYSESAGEEKH
jgi:acyl-CoA reductase-like NAD-dependent aldehyde dehydrogenase